MSEQLLRLGAVTVIDKTNAKVANFAKAAGELNTALSTATDPTKAVLKRDAAAVENLSKLVLTVQSLKLSNLGLVVRVLEAKFGDTYPNPRDRLIAKRWCDATAYMRIACDRKASCSVPATYQNDVCGYNPAPAADPRNRGLYVLYECVLDTEDNFRGRYTGSDFVEGSVRLRRPPNQYVVLRGNGGLQCGASK